MHSRFDLSATPASPAATKSRKTAMPSKASVGIRGASEGKGATGKGKDVGKGKKGRASSGENKEGRGAKRHKSSR